MIRTKKQLTEEQQQAYMQAQLIHQHLQQHTEQLQKVDEKIGEVNTLMEALQGIGTQQEKTLATIGGGVFLETQLKNTESVYVNVGANIIVKKKIPDVQKLLTQQIQELTQYRMQIALQAQELQEQLHMLQHQIEGTQHAHG